MRRIEKIVILHAMSFIATGLVFSQPSAKVETITGEIVAYGDGLVCMNGNAYWSMLIRVQNANADSRAKFIQVQFSLPCKQNPESLNEKLHTQKFRVEREQNADSIFEEYSKCAPESTEQCLSIPIWRLVPGAENEKLPFGELVPSYRSPDLPLDPIL